MPDYTFNDWEYVSLTNAAVNDTTAFIYPSGSISGSVITDVLDLGQDHAGPTMITVNGLDLQVYYKTEDSTDWVLCDRLSRTEHILIPFEGEINTEFDIAFIENLQFERAYRQGEELNLDNLVGYARVDYSTVSMGEEADNILTGALVVGNHIKLATASDLPARSNISIVYIPKQFVFDDIGRYLQIKVIFKSFDSHLESIKVDFRYRTFENLKMGTPTFYRRI